MFAASANNKSQKCLYSNEKLSSLRQKPNSEAYKNTQTFQKPHKKQRK